MGGGEHAVCGCLNEPLRFYEEGKAVHTTTVINADGRKVVARGRLKGPLRFLEGGLGGKMHGVINTSVRAAASSPTRLSGTMTVQ